MRVGRRWLSSRWIGGSRGRGMLFHYLHALVHVFVVVRYIIFATQKSSATRAERGSWLERAIHVCACSCFWNIYNFCYSNVNTIMCHKWTRWNAFMCAQVNRKEVTVFDRL